jgi:predicted transcriptional regulator of viral defense system
MPESTAAARAKEIFARNNGMLRTRDALRLGIHPRTLYEMRDRGEIEQISRGLYRLATAPPLTNPDWVTVATRIPQAVICLISALAHHHLTTEIPHTIDIALPMHARVPRIGLPIRSFWFSEPAFSTGVEAARFDGVAVRTYSAEKTIADCFKYRNKIGPDVAIEALKEYRRNSKRADLQKIVRYAKLWRVENVMRPYLESLL